MPLCIVNNPIDRLLKIFEDTFPNDAKQIKLISFEKLDEGFAVTIKDDSDDKFLILLSSTIKGNEPITFEVATELLAHELSHVVNFDAEDPHGVEWEETFEKLNVLFCNSRDSEVGSAYIS